jgi:hypothetical protein
MRKNLFLTVVWMQRQLTQVNVHRTDVNLGHQPWDREDNLLCHPLLQESLVSQQVGRGLLESRVSLDQQERVGSVESIRTLLWQSHRNSSPNINDDSKHPQA